MKCAAKYQPVGRVVVRKIGEDTLLVPVSGMAATGGRVYPMNETAEFLWNVFSEGATVDQAAAELTERYDVAEEESRADTLSCLHAFLEEALLEEVVS